jgi:hypothetical protein
MARTGSSAPGGASALRADRQDDEALRLGVPKQRVIARSEAT